MTEFLLVFPPQWSPFQPALSLPSLSAWLKRAGFRVSSLDLNVLFYEWLFSDECAAMLSEWVTDSTRTQDVKEAYLAIFSKVSEFRTDVRSLQAATVDEVPVDYAARNYLAIQSLGTYLDAISRVVETFTISPYQFRLTSGNLNLAGLEHQVAAPSPLIERFLQAAIEKHVLPLEPRMVGLSCIGQEQLYFTILLGSRLKQELDVPVIVGGTIFSRIFERGVLPAKWFSRYFDMIIRNEGEKPTERILHNLRSGRLLAEDVPGVVYLKGGGVASSPPCPPLDVSELPIPDFDDMPLGRYLSGEITLPLLSARGCYWGKCEFCHHGMVYGEKYTPYKAPSLLKTVATLAARYNVKRFAFNDEALPPTSARAIASIFPPHQKTGWTFTGLIKFEPFYTRQDFVGLHKVGFRSLYAGLESASERVLDLMRKRSKRETIVANLTEATQAGIWMHCFLFFGFPGETDAEAQETYDFILQNAEIVSSFGGDTFSLEHNAPIFHHLEDFGVRLDVTSRNNIDVYYGYEVDRGVSAARALEWHKQLNVAARHIDSYNAVTWVPRELLLCMLSRMTPEELCRVGLMMRECGGMPATTRLQEIIIRIAHQTQPDTDVVVNRLNGRAVLLKGPAARLFDLCYQHNVHLRLLQERAPMLFDRLAFLTKESSEECVLA